MLRLKRRNPEFLIRRLSGGDEFVYRIKKFPYDSRERMISFYDLHNQHNQIIKY